MCGDRPSRHKYNRARSFSRPKYHHVLLRLLAMIVTVLGALGHIIPAAGGKADLPRISRYYATAINRCYETATPSNGSVILFNHYKQWFRRETLDDRDKVLSQTLLIDALGAMGRQLIQVFLLLEGDR